jgi:hypothetical protein
MVLGSIFLRCLAFSREQVTVTFLELSTDVLAIF